MKSLGSKLSHLFTFKMFVTAVNFDTEIPMTYLERSEIYGDHDEERFVRISSFV